MRDVDVAPGWYLLRTARPVYAAAEYAEAERAYYAGAEAWCVALRTALALGCLPVPESDLPAICPYPACGGRAWWWDQGYDDAEACWLRALRQTEGDRREVDHV